MMPKERERETQKQVALQHIEDIWDRIIFYLETLEIKNNEREQYSRSYIKEKITAGVMSLKKLQSKTIEDLERILQIVLLSFVRGAKNKAFNFTVDSELKWRLKDYIKWFSGRFNCEWSNIDKYSLPIIKALVTRDFEEVRSNLPDINEEYEEEEEVDMNSIMEKFTIAQTAVDKREDSWVEKENFEAEQTKHQRGNIEKGIKRIRENWNEPEDIRWFEKRIVPLLMEDNKSKNYRLYKEGTKIPERNEYNVVIIKNNKLFKELEKKYPDDIEKIETLEELPNSFLNKI